MNTEESESEREIEARPHGTTLALYRIFCAA